MLGEGCTKWQRRVVLSAGGVNPPVAIICSEFGGSENPFAFKIGKVLIPIGAVTSQRSIDKLIYMKNINLEFL